jgi:DNA-directed RNA polymerase sigma subunit (sigma70/sigma32)
MTQIADKQVQRAAVERDDDAAVPDRDLVGTYLHEISRTPLLDAAQEVELSKAVEAGLYADELLTTGQYPAGATEAELRTLVAEGQRAKDAFILANLRLVVSIARRYTRSAMPLLDLVQARSSTTREATSSPRTPRGGSGRRSAGPSRSRPVRSGCPCTSWRRSTGCATCAGI